MIKRWIIRAGGSPAGGTVACQTTTGWRDRWSRRERRGYPPAYLPRASAHGPSPADDGDDGAIACPGPLRRRTSSDPTAQCLLGKQGGAKILSTPQGQQGTVRLAATADASPPDQQRSPPAPHRSSKAQVSPLVWLPCYRHCPAEHRRDKAALPTGPLSPDSPQSRHYQSNHWRGQARLAPGYPARPGHGPNGTCYH